VGGAERVGAGAGLGGGLLPLLLWAQIVPVMPTNRATTANRE